MCERHRLGEGLWSRARSVCVCVCCLRVGNVERPAPRFAEESGVTGVQVGPGRQHPTADGWKRHQLLQMLSPRLDGAVASVL